MPVAFRFHLNVCQLARPLLTLKPPNVFFTKTISFANDGKDINSTGPCRQCVASAHHMHVWDVGVGRCVLSEIGIWLSGAQTVWYVSSLYEILR